MTNRVFIAWVEHHRRPELLAPRLGARVHFIHAGRRGPVRHVPSRYLAQSRRTWRLLEQERPGVVFVQNPPIVAALLVALYAWRRGAQYVIDSHTGAFVSRRWRWSLGLHRLLSKRALTTIVHNEHQARVLEGWGCRHHVVGFVKGTYPEGEAYPLSGDFNVAVICGQMGGDEPMEVIFRAAAALPDVCFHITGDPNLLAPALRDALPANVRLTGYLPYGQYIGLLRAVDAMMVLTTRDQSLLMGGFEAISLEVPLIVSDWPLLRGFFSQGTVYVANTPSGLADGVRRMQREHVTMRQAMRGLRSRLETELDGQIAALQAILPAA